MKIKVKDQVKIIAGKDKGKKGEVIKTDTTSGKITVKGINVLTKFFKKTAERPGEMIKAERPIDISKAKVICPNCSNDTRIGYQKDKEGKKYRICKKCNEPIDKK